MEMFLWNDYEGKTIAGSYPLEKLLRPEGRSAFFSTSNGTGTPAVIRITEALNDEQEMLARWDTVSHIQQPNLVTIRRFGQADFEGTPILYAILEPTDASLADVLPERPLTLEETRQVAVSVVSALEALHARNLIHGHIEPVNVLAAGEVVKLRSDCVREAPEGAEAAELKIRDVHDLAVLLLQCLTQRRQLSPATPALASPFGEIIRNGISGLWGLPQIAAALQIPRTPAAASGAAAASPAASARPAAEATAAVSGSAAAGAAAAAAGRAATPSGTATSGVTPQRRPPSPAATSPAGSSAATAPAARAPRRPTLDATQLKLPPNIRLIAGAAAVLALLLLIILLATRHSNGAASRAVASPATQTTVRGNTATTTTAAASPGNASAATTNANVATSNAARVAVIAEPAGDAALRAAKPSPARDSNGASLTSGVAATAVQWRVVAYTYNHAAQAQEKARSLAAQHPALTPEVFTPSGLPPYMVTLGGPLSREQALAFRQKALAQGLPRDLYIQNYSARSR